MALWDDDRGQAIQIGAVLLFAVLVIAFSLYQAFVVPNQNERVEMDHLQVVEGEMQDLRNAIVSVPQSGDGRSARLTLGTSYPARAIALNPPPPTGRLQTVGTDNEQINFTLANVRALDDETADYWDGTTNRTRLSGALVYDPDYNVLQNAPTLVYDTTALSSQFRDANLWASGQTLVDGRTLTLVALDGTLDRSSSRSLAVDVEAISASTTDVAITNETGENVTVTFSSHRSAADWKSLLIEEGQWHNASGGHVVAVEGTSISDRFDQITMELERNETYELRMGKAGVGTGATDSRASYVTDISGNGTGIRAGETQRLTVAVRDGFNGPISGIELIASASSGTASVRGLTDSRGQTTVEYTAPSTPATDTTENITVRKDLDGSGTVDPAEQVEFTVTVTTDSSGGDSTSPRFRSGPTAEPDTVRQGNEFNLTATLDNIGTGGTDIVNATWSDNQGNNGVLLPMDGSFDQPREAVLDTISTSGWSEGNHTLSVVGADGNGNKVSETVTITVQPSLPGNAVAFDDENGNGIYDDGETTYAESEFYGTFNNNVDLIVGRDISAGGNKIDIKANSLTVSDDVTLSTSNGKNINADISGNIDISGATLTANGKNADLSIKADGNIDAKDTILRFGRDASAEADGGTLSVNDTGDSDPTNGGTYIEDQNGTPAELVLEKGDLAGSPESGSVNVK